MERTGSNGSLISKNRKSKERLYSSRRGSSGELVKEKCISKEQVSKEGNRVASKMIACAVTYPPEGSNFAPATFLTPNAEVKIPSQRK